MTVNDLFYMINSVQLSAAAASNPSRDIVVAKMNAWVKTIAADNTYHYKKWSSNEKTHYCPICKNYPVKEIDTSNSSSASIKGFHGWNCIGFAWAVWHHGGGIPCKCNCSVISNDEGNKIYKAKNNTERLKLVKNYSGLNDVIILFNKNGIPKSQWQAGDIALMYSGSTYVHTFYVMGNGKIADACGSNGKVARNNQIAIRSDSSYSAKLIVRYTGWSKIAPQPTPTPTPKPTPVKKAYTGEYPKVSSKKILSYGKKGANVKKWQRYLNWYFGKKVIKVDGVFGKETKKYTKKFQNKEIGKGQGDGLVGPKTIKAAKKVKK